MTVEECWNVDTVDFSEATFVRFPTELTRDLFEFGDP